MRSRYTVRETERAHFVTSTIVDWLPLFTLSSCCDILAQSLDFCRQKKGLRLYAWVILVIIDDMGLKALPANSGEYLLEVIMRRYENRSTIMTSNRPLEDWGKLLSDVAAGGYPRPLPAPCHPHRNQRAQLPGQGRGPGWRRCRPCPQRQAPDALRRPGSGPEMRCR